MATSNLDVVGRIAYTCLARFGLVVGGSSQPHSFRLLFVEQRRVGTCDLDRDK